MKILKFITVFGISIIYSTTAVFAAIPEETLKTIQNEVNKVVADIPNRQLSSCTTDLPKIYDTETLVFLDFLDKHFQNKSSNSSLSSVAIQRYMQYKKRLGEILVKYQTNFPEFGEDLSSIKETLAYIRCSEIMNAYVELARLQMIEHIKTTASIKKAMVLTEKLYSINERLAGLNTDISEVYGFLMVFKNKLPGFTNMCVKS